MAKVMIRANDIKNRMYLYLEGSPSAVEMLSLKDKFLMELNKCQKGFTVMTIFDNFSPDSQKVFKVAATLTQILKKAGVSKVARVTTNSHIILKKIDQIAKGYGGYNTGTFRTFEEAEDYLDGLKS
ncbi:hypothetical protein ACFL4T_14670 [candidate division KSB1 bacterium]